MRRGVYTVSMNLGNIFSVGNTDYDFFEITPAAGKPVEIVGFEIGGRSIVGDANEWMIDYSIVRGNTVTGTGSTGNIRALDPSDPAASFTAKIALTVPASSGTPVNLVSGTFNARAGIRVHYIPEMRPVVAFPWLLCIRMNTALSVNQITYGTIWVREL
jgi:hypothetical protein